MLGPVVTDDTTRTTSSKAITTTIIPNGYYVLQPKADVLLLFRFQD